jgi:hypothetical protein
VCVWCACAHVCQFRFTWVIGEVLGMTPEEASKDTNAFGPEKEREGEGWVDGWREGGRKGGRKGGRERARERESSDRGGGKRNNTSKTAV